MDLALFFAHCFLPLVQCGRGLVTFYSCPSDTHHTHQFGGEHLRAELGEVLGGLQRGADVHAAPWRLDAADVELGAVGLRHLVASAHTAVHRLLVQRVVYFLQSAKLSGNGSRDRG